MGSGPWIKHLHHDAERFDGWAEVDGMPGVSLFANAVQVWAIAQNRQVSVDEAAVSFNVSESVIVDAVEWHPFMFLQGDLIAHDGE